MHSLRNCLGSADFIGNFLGLHLLVGRMSILLYLNAASFSSGFSPGMIDTPIFMRPGGPVTEATQLQQVHTQCLMAKSFPPGPSRGKLVEFL